MGDEKTGWLYLMQMEMESFEIISVQKVRSGIGGKSKDGATASCHLTEAPLGSQLEQCAEVTWCPARSLLGPA